MPRKGETGTPPSRYMTLAEVAQELRISTESVRAKVLAGELAGADVGNGSQRQVLRVQRKAFDAYCERIESDAARRFKAAA